MEKNMAANNLISPTNLWGKPLPTTALPTEKKLAKKVTGKMTDSDDVMDDDEIDVDAELANADVEEDDELVTADAEDDVDVTGDLEDDDEADDEEPEYDDDVTDEDQDVVEKEEVVTAVANDEDAPGNINVSRNTRNIAAMAEKMSLSDHVRAEIARRQKSGEEMRGKDIVAALAKRKIEVSPAQVSQLLKKAGLGGKTRGRKPANAAAADTTAVTEKSRMAEKLKRSTKQPPMVETLDPPPRAAAKAQKEPATCESFNLPMTQLRAAEAFVTACGGSFKSATQILTAAESLSKTFNG